VKEYSEQITLIAGSANPELSKAISRVLDVPLAKAEIGRFPDGEIDIKVEDDLRGGDCFIIQPICPPVNDSWIELLLLIDTLRRASAGRITAVMPYYGYARKDRKDEGRVPISAKVVANTLSVGGCDRLVTIDMHAAQIQGFYDIPVDHLYARPVLLHRLRKLNIDNPVVVSPDVGGMKMARGYAKPIGADLAIVDKRRISGSKVEVEHIIGDVSNRNVIIVDDMISTGGSVTEAAGIVCKNGARSVMIVVTHPVFCGPAIERLQNTAVDKVLVTDTIPSREDWPEKIEVVSVASLLAQAIHNIHNSTSVSVLFKR
jgi:ribose-phosphate pyrophosphokinase